MAGYTPLFQSLTTGTLCGKWPDIGLWPIVLSLSDRHGTVDVTCQYISTITGLPLDEVIACMERFCQPDPQSRTSDADGRRLELIDPTRQWGWRIVNHRKYSEKVRLMHKNAREVESGANKSRTRSRKKTAADRRRPPDTAPQSQAQSQAHKDDAPENLNPEAWKLYEQHRRELKVKKLTARGRVAAMNKLAALPPDQQMKVVETSISNGWQGLFPERAGASAKESYAEWLHAGMKRKGML